tara:strand:+ start:66 stop:215 length:150 start_codon:yes stop_codon:yes gene_type:complete
MKRNKKKNKKIFKLTCQAGVYEAGSFTGLIFEVLKHRTHHLITEGRWID